MRPPTVPPTIAPTLLLDEEEELAIALVVTAAGVVVTVVYCTVTCPSDIVDDWLCVTVEGGGVVVTITTVSVSVSGSPSEQIVPYCVLYCVTRPVETVYSTGTVVTVVARFSG